MVGRLRRRSRRCRSLIDGALDKVGAGSRKIDIAIGRQHHVGGRRCRINVIDDWRVQESRYHAWTRVGMRVMDRSSMN